MASTKVLNRIKRYLIEQSTSISNDCPLKPASVEAVHSHLLAHLIQCLKSPCQTPDMPKALCVLQQLCDSFASRQPFEEASSFVNLVADCDSSGFTLSQGESSPATPLRVPSVLTLFKTPPAAPSNNASSLRVRLMKSAGKSLDTPVRGTRSKPQRSCLSWAPDNLSPIQPIPPSYAGPVVGPTLVASGCSNDVSTEECLQMIASLPDSRLEAQKALVENKNKKRSSKRSLLSDMSNLAGSEAPSVDEVKNKKQKTSRPPVKKKIAKLPSNQKSITSFFSKNLWLLLRVLVSIFLLNSIKYKIVFYLLVATEYHICLYCQKVKMIMKFSLQMILQLLTTILFNLGFEPKID